MPSIDSNSATPANIAARFIASRCDTSDCAVRPLIVWMSEIGKSGSMSRSGRAKSAHDGRWLSGGLDGDPSQSRHGRRLGMWEVGGADRFDLDRESFEPHFANDAHDGERSELPTEMPLPIGSSFGHSRCASRSSTIATR